ncbi:hypothetical protein WICANDRAFT_27296 [Wickerhamomyces anomalus NRRL Y-366-8]|uniref:REM-1 domain-containing protein n=1 Tax=Wickerhamomyces anomalus (strain ATCC 58044 / CBS 1984 / NCYC 433 / NRRL Y-366-8) TaxID=683960 RepID=A0A1E3PDL9_WICAA|nr:uncharacterized protein WICANDRAFT_27296 [Wickerhamomyces anomalus NRRL Y-366-8]ODQ62957.1 hypothetical protein WICANDRAFT_27296 [Wickerhamomyces anomalus NRRL Y-366-8]
MSYVDDDDSFGSFSDGETNDVAESPTFAVTDLLTSLGEKNQDADYLVTKGNDLVILLQQYPYIKEDLVFSAFGHRIQNLLIHSKKEVVATGYRICRYFVSDTNSIKNLMALRIDVMIVVSFAKGSGYDIEREQALKLVRRIMAVKDGVNELTLGIANAIQAIAEQIDEKMRNVCIQTMCEMSLLRPDLIRPDSLVQFIIDGPFEQSHICTIVLLAHLDSAVGRSYIRRSDILRLISPFTEFPVKGHLNNEKLQVSALVLSRLLKNFAGLNAFSINNFEPLKDLIACLSYPVNSVVSKLLDLLLDILMINPLNKKITSHNKMVLVPMKPENEFILTTQYLSMMILILMECGVIEMLLDVIKKSEDESNCTKAGFLLTEIFNLTNNLVPTEMLEKFVDAIPRLNEDYETSLSDSINAIYAIEKLSRKSNKGRANWGLQNVKTNENFIQISKNSKNKTNLNIDDTRMKQMMQESRVLTTKSFSKWNCDVLTDLFKGPFMNGKRLEEVNRTTKFLKRLLSFYRPFKHKFSGTKKTRQSQRFTRLGCVIVETLLTTNEGLRILSDGKMLPQIAECLAQVDPFSGFVAKEQIFSKERLATTLTDGYFKILGIFSSSEVGNKLLEQWKIFSIMHHISDDSFKRDDLIFLFMDEIKFGRQGHSRVLLSKFLHSQNKAIKIHATNLIPKLLHEKESNAFACEILVDQLYDADFEVCSLAIDILNKYCEESEENLMQIISLSPSIPILKLMGSSGNCLLMKFLSAPTGFTYLNNSNFINEELESWVYGNKYLSYVLQIERMLMAVEDVELESIKTRNLPSNFFGELVQTEEGFNVVLRSGAFTEFMNVIRLYSTSLLKPLKEIEIDFLKTKACLWTIGFIGSSTYGIESLDVNGCIEDVVQIANNSSNIGMRGTAFYVLGLIARTDQGIEILDDLGWNSKLNLYDKPIGITVPYDINQFFEGNESKLEISLPGSRVQIESLDKNDEVLEKLMELIGNLCNHVFLNSATKELTSLSKRYPEYFEDPDIFFQVLKYFEVYKYRYTIRKFIIELFIGNGRLLEVVARRDRRRIRERTA